MPGGPGISVGVGRDGLRFLPAGEIRIGRLFARIGTPTGLERAATVSNGTTTVPNRSQRYHNRTQRYHNRTHPCTNSR
jgi:hypothetical protein